MGSLLGAWYRTGTVSVEKDSNQVAGVDTFWTSALLRVVAGDIFTVDSSKWYEVIAVDDDNTLYLNDVFEGETSLDTNYAIIRSTSGTVLTSVAGQIALQFNQKQLLLDEIRVWLNSSSETESVTDSHGVTFELKTPTQMAVEHEQRLNEAEDAISIITQLTSSNGNIFKNNTGAVKTITAQTYINGVIANDISAYRYKWTSDGSQIYVSATGDYVQLSPSTGLYAANGEDDEGLNLQSIIVDSSDVDNDNSLNISCEVSNI